MSKNDKNNGGVKPINCDAAMEVTTLMDLQTYAQGTVVRLPDFAEGQPFVARLRRPSMLVLAKSGKIPNNLLVTANELFNGKDMDTDNQNAMADVYDIVKILCESALVEPKLADIEAAGLTLADDQMMTIFNYTQIGVKALESFRTE